MMISSVRCVVLALVVVVNGPAVALADVTGSVPTTSVSPTSQRPTSSVSVDVSRLDAAQKQALRDASVARQRAVRDALTDRVAANATTRATYELARDKARAAKKDSSARILKALQTYLAGTRENSRRYRQRVEAAEAVYRATLRTAGISLSDPATAGADPSTGVGGG